MKCPICERKELLEKLKQHPHDQQLLLSLGSLLHCEGMYITTGITRDKRNSFCKTHQSWINHEYFLRTLNMPETISLLFRDGEKARFMN